MKTGFTFKNRHSGEFGVVMKTVSRPIHPEMKSYTYESPLMDGTYDFSSSNNYGREFYRNRIFTLLLQVYADNINELIQNISRISTWLTGKGELMFDDMPFVKWRACVLNSVDYAPEQRGRKAMLTVSFEVQPFSLCIFDTSNGIMLGEVLRINASMPIGIDRAFTFDTDTITVINPGTWYARPVLIYDSSGQSPHFTSLTVICGDKTINLSGFSNKEKIIIDLKKHTVTDGNGNNMMQYMSGEFFELSQGENEITSTAANVPAFTTQVIYTPEFMYGFDWNWSDEDA